MKDRVTKQIEYLKKKMYEDASRITSINKLTTKSKELGQEFIAGDYIKRFNNELKCLTKETVNH